MSAETDFSARMTLEDLRESDKEAADRRKGRNFSDLRDEMDKAIRRGVASDAVHAPMTSKYGLLALRVAFGEALVSPAIDVLAGHLLHRVIAEALMLPSGDCKLLAERLCELVSIQHAEDNT